MPSTSGAIADAFVTAIRGLGLAGAPAVVPRKRVVLADGDPPALVVVAQGDGETLEALGDFGGGLVFLTRYPVSVGFLGRNRGRVGDDPATRQNRQAVRDRLNAPGVIPLAGLNDVQPGGEPVFDLAGLGQGLDWSVLTFRVEVIE